MLKCPSCGYTQVSVAEAAEIIGVSGEMVRNYVGDGALPEPMQLDVPGGNRKWMLPMDAVRALARARRARIRKAARAG